MTFLFIEKFQHTIIPTAISFERRGFTPSTSVNSNMAIFDTNTFIRNRVPYIINCKKAFLCDLKDQNLFKVKLILKATVIAIEFDHTYHNSIIWYSK